MDPLFMARILMTLACRTTDKNLASNARSTKALTKVSAEDREESWTFLIAYRQSLPCRMQWVDMNSRSCTISWIRCSSSNLLLLLLPVLPPFPFSWSVILVTSVTTQNPPRPRTLPSVNSIKDCRFDKRERGERAQQQKGDNNENALSPRQSH